MTTSLIPPKKDTFPVPSFDRLTMLIFGKPGSGKTRFLAGAPDTLFISTEPGQEFTKATVVDLNVPQTITVGEGDAAKEIEVVGWGKFQYLVKELADMKRNDCLPYKCVAIDIIDNLLTMSRDWVCSQKGIAHPSDDKKYGKVWAECNTVWTKWLGALMRIANVHMVSHASVETHEITNDAGIREEIDQFVPTCSGNKAAQFLDGVVNAMGFVTQTKDGKRVITFQQSPRVAAKDRTDILEKLGVITLPDNPDHGFMSVAEAYAAKAHEMGFEIIK